MPLHSWLKQKCELDVWPTGISKHMVKCGIVIGTISFIHAYKQINNEYGDFYAHPLFTVFMHNWEWSEMHLATDQYDGLSTGTGAGSGIS